MPAFLLAKDRLPSSNSCLAKLLVGIGWHAVNPGSERIRRRGRCIFLCTIEGGCVLPSWWRRFVNLVNDKQVPSRRGRKQRRRSGFHYQPRVEQFEDRIVPTTLSIPTNLVATQGGVIQVPINVDTLNS